MISSNIPPDRIAILFSSLWGASDVTLGLLRTARHRSRIRATRWLAMTISQNTYPGSIRCMMRLRKMKMWASAAATWMPITHDQYQDENSKGDMKCHDGRFHVAAKIRQQPADRVLHHEKRHDDPVEYLRGGPVLRVLG